MAEAASQSFILTESDNDEDVQENAKNGRRKMVIGKIVNETASDSSEGENDEKGSKKTVCGGEDCSCPSCRRGVLGKVGSFSFVSALLKIICYLIR